jgi:hypothetical protein
MNANTNQNTKKDTASKTPWGPIAFVLTALLTIMVLMPTNFSRGGYLTSKIAPNDTIVTTDQSGDQLSGQWTAKNEEITFDHMYQDAVK